MNAADTTIPSSRVEERPLMVMDMADNPPVAWGGADPLMDRLQRWAGDAYWQLLSHHKGHIVRQTHQGLMMEFADARHCVQAAFALNQLADALNARADASKHLHLRAGAHLACYGLGQREPVDRDVQLTSELTSLAAPGEFLVTAELRDRLANGLDADFEDLGHWVESFVQPVRLFRAHPRHETLPDRLAAANTDLRPALAVIPFQASVPDVKHWMLGELIADGVIARLSHSVGLRVIARQSTSALRGSGELAEIERHLGATFILSGCYSIRNNKLVVTAELAEARSHTLLWTGQLQHALDDLLQEQSELLHELARTVAHALGKTQVSQALSRPLPSLDSSFLMLAGISMVHSHSGKAFDRGREALATLTERHPEHALPRAWLALWHALNVVKGTSGNTTRDIKLAREQTLYALQAEPHNSMALAVEGYIQCQLLGDPQQANSFLTAAVEANPSEPMAWLFKSLYSAAWGSSSLSVTEAYVARSLSPVDPLQYFFDLLTGNALLADRQLEQALACGRLSLRAHKHHVPTLRLLLTAHAELGQLDEGKAVLAQLRAEAPELTISSYVSMGSQESPLRQRIADAMRMLGLPET
jgi:adenylate cyclase